MRSFPGPGILSALMLGLALPALPVRPARAAVLRVPADYAALQDAVTAAAAGDTILVDSGNYAGARVDKPLAILGMPGSGATLVGPGSPTGWNGLAIGLSLEAGADGTRIENLTFDGAGISDDNPAPLAFAVYGRHLRDVVVRNNTIRGTVQAITGTAAYHWTIQDNTLTDFTTFVCKSYCGGGDAIVLQADRSGVDTSLPVNRPRDNTVKGNSIWGAVPDGLKAFGMNGILLLSADSTEVSQNYVAIPQNPRNRSVEGVAIMVIASCCGVPDPWLPGSRFATLLDNDGMDSDWGLVVEGSGGQNTEGLVRMGNTGRTRIEGVVFGPIFGGMAGLSGSPGEATADSLGAAAANRKFRRRGLPRAGARPIP